MMCGPDAEIYSVWLQGSSVFISIFINLTIPGQSFTYAGENSFYYLHFFRYVCPPLLGMGVLPSLFGSSRVRTPVQTTSLLSQ